MITIRYTRKFWIGGIILFILIALIVKVLSGNSAQKIVKEPPQAKTFLVETLMIAPEEHQATLKLPGVSEADKEVHLESEVEGLVVFVNDDKGKYLPKGTALIKMDLKALPAQKNQLEKKVAYLEHLQTTEKKLEEKSLGSINRALKVEADLAEATAALKDIEVQIDKSVLKMPFDGILEDTYVDEGSVVKMGDKLAYVVDLSTLVVKLKVPENLWSSFQKAQKAEVVFPDGKIKEGEITYKSRSADEKTHTYSAEVKVDNLGDSYPQGQSVDVKFFLSAEEAFRLPQQTLTLNDDGILGVKLLNDQNIVHFYPIQVLSDEKEDMWVKGLPLEQNRIISNGQEYVKEGQKVSPVDAKTNK